jgi:exopolysaccharide biosynthesis polyprenyl glycosylphosphotransferase
MLRRHRQLRTRLHQFVDASLFAIGFWLAHAFWAEWKLRLFPESAAIEPFVDLLWLCVVIILLAPVLLESQGLYNRQLLDSRRGALWALAKGCALMVLALIVVMFIFKSTPARVVIALSGVIAFGLIALKEELVRWGLKSRLGHASFSKRLLLVGTKEDAQVLQRGFPGSTLGGFEIVAELDLNEATIEQLIELLHEHSINGVILTAKHTLFGQVEKAIQACELEGVEVWLVADFFKTQISRTSLDEFHGRPVMVFCSAPEVSWQAMTKQLFDYCGACFLLVVLALPLLAVALLIKISSPGPVLFRQKRSGLNGQPFTMYKFRSMVSDAEQRKQELADLNEMSGPVFKITNDPRITPIGRFLRRSSIDELPQLINVLRGEMSLVGPRPLPVDEVKRFDDLAHRRRLSVKPGLTCTWQVSGRNNVADFTDWVRLDLEYIDNWSLWLDVKILCRTVPVVLFAKGAK